MLTQERLKELLHYDPDTGIFINLTQRNDRAKKGSIAGYKNPRGYVVIRIYCKLYRAHRLAWLYVYGKWPEDQIDHANQIKDDNRIANLRSASRQENEHNKSKPRADNTSGLVGASWYEVG